MSEFWSQPLFRLLPTLQQSGRGIVLRYSRLFRAMPFIVLALAVLHITLSVLLWPNVNRQALNESLLLIFLALILGWPTWRLNSVVIDREAGLMTIRSFPARSRQRPLTDVVAVQIERPRWSVCRLSLVLSGGRRLDLALFGSLREKPPRELAQKLADYIGVPLDRGNHE